MRIHRNKRRGGVATACALVGGVAAALPTAGAAQVFVWDAGGDGVTWTDANNWFNPSLNDYPRFAGDTALITATGAAGTGNPPVLDRDLTLGDLEIVNGGDVFSGFGTNHRFNVVNETLITGTDSSLRLFNSPNAVDLETTTLTINGTGVADDAGLILTGSTVRIDGSAATNAGGHLRGYGTVLLNSTTGNFLHDGTLTVPQDRTLTVDQTATNIGHFDWDGISGQTAVIDIGIDATLDLNVDQNNDAFGGTIRIARGGDLDNAVPWTLDSGGRIEFGGASTGFPGDVVGGAVTTRGVVDASTGSGLFRTDWNATQGAVNIGNTGGAISQISVRDGRIAPAVDFNFDNGNFIVNGDFTIDRGTGLFDMDGAFNNNRLFVGDTGVLRVLAGALNPNTGAFTTNRYSGTLSLAGRLELDANGPDLLIAKRNAGDAARVLMFARGDSVASYGGMAVVFGGDSTLQVFESSGSGEKLARFDARVRFDGNTLEIEPDTTLEFTERVEFRGGSAGYTNTGTMRFADQLVVNTGSLTLPFATEFTPGSSAWLVGNNNLRLDAPTRFETTSLSGGATSEVRLNGGTTVAGGLTTATGIGVFDLDGLASDGDLTIESGATLDLDVGRIDNSGNGFAATMNLAGTFAIDVDGGLWRQRGTINLQAGRLVGAQLFSDGTLTNTGRSILDMSVDMDRNSTAVINGTLEYRTGLDSVIRSSVDVSGTGVIEVSRRAARLTLEDVDLGAVPVVNAGRLGFRGFLSFGDGSLMQSYTQSASGILEIDLAAGGGNDRLNTALSAQLDGTLDVREVSLGGPLLSLGETFRVVDADGGVAGRFSDVIAPTLTPGLVWELRYLADAVELAVIAGLAGDYNGSGRVEQGDLDLVLTNWGRDVRTAGVPTGWVNDLPHGPIDQRELDGVLNNWGSMVPPSFAARPSLSPVPEPSFAAPLLLAGWGWRRRRRRGGVTGYA